jgi:hypothetical protein
VISSEISGAVSKALYMLPPAMTSPEARVMLYAIGLQESRFAHRFQVVQGRPGAKGPARGFWQFERLGGCRGVVDHPASRYWMHHLCKSRGVDFTATAVWHAIETDDVLAAGAARLLLFTDPRKLPALGDEKGAWNLYVRTWRPGKPHPKSWPDLYAQAMGKVAA